MFFLMNANVRIWLRLNELYPMISEASRNYLKKQTKLCVAFPTFFSSDSFIQFNTKH